MSKKRNIIIGVIALLLVVSVGYAIFSDTLNINGTATAKGDFQINIIEATIAEEVGSSGATVNIVNGGKGLNLNIQNLEYPGAHVTVKYKIKNTGTIPAIFKKRLMSGISLEDYDNLKRIYVSAPLSKLFYDSTEEQEEEFTIGWRSDDATSEEEENINITYDISFEQIEGKNQACSRLKTLSENIAQCDFYQDEAHCIYDESEMDINGDTYADGGDSTIIENILLGMGCSN